MFDDLVPKPEKRVLSDAEFQTAVLKEERPCLMPLGRRSPNSIHGNLQLSN
jgi:hypothetical protein